MMAKKKEFEKEKKRHASGESTLSSDSVSAYIPVPPDGGYGWVIVFASFMNHVIVDGFAFTFGVFIDDFTEYFGVGKARTAVVGSLMAGCYLLSGTILIAWKHMIIIIIIMIVIIIIIVQERL